MLNPFERVTVSLQHASMLYRYSFCPSRPVFACSPFFDAWCEHIHKRPSRMKFEMWQKFDYEQWYLVSLDAQACFRLFPIFYDLYEGVNSYQYLILYFCTEINYLLVCVLLRDNLGVSFCSTNFLFPRYKCMVQMSSTGCHNCTKWVHFQRRDIISRASHQENTGFDWRKNWLVDSCFLTYKPSAKSRGFVYCLMCLFLRSNPDQVCQKARFSKKGFICEQFFDHF